MKTVFSISSIFLILLLTVLLLGGCENKEDNKINDSTTTTKVTTTTTINTTTTTKQVINKDVLDVDNITLLNCEECVFAFYTDRKSIGSTLSSYTKDFKKLKDKNGNQRRRFLGHILDENNIIQRAFVCGIEEEKVFCIEGAKGEDEYNDNTNILDQVFSDVDCEYTSNNSTYTCVGETNAETKIDGSVSVSFDNSCYIKSGQIYCN